MSLPGKILALDYGHTIGLAVSDDAQQMAFGRGAIDREKGFPFVCRYIRDLCLKESIQQIVIGLPFDIEGKDTEQTLRFRHFAEKLEVELKPLPIFFQDEAFTTFEANEFLAHVGVQVRDRKKNEDEMAAIFILQRYLKSIEH